MLINLKPEFYKEKMSSSRMVYSVLLSALHTFDPLDQDKEIFFAIGLKRNLKINYCEAISIGNLTGTIVSVREVFRRSIAFACDTIVISHNHPSGQLIPSIQDDKITKSLKEASKIIGIQIIDHVIFSEEGWYSYADEGKL